MKNNLNAEKKEGTQEESGLRFNKDVQDRTEGYRPRSREADTRTMIMEETQENIDHWRQMFSKESIAKTYIHPSEIPQGLTTLWARYKVNNMVDGRNVRELRGKGWKRASPDLFPSLACMDGDGNLLDDEQDIINNEFILMFREDFIHREELRAINTKTKNKENSFKLVGNDSNFQGLKPFANVRSEGENLHDYYASSSAGKEFLNNFS